MNGFGQQILPVGISIILIIFIAILRSYSTTVAAITATMPIMVPLAFWIVYTGEGGDMMVMTSFLQTMVFGVLATLISVVAMWYVARAGWGLVGILAACYGAWAIALSFYAAITKVLSTYRFPE